MIDPTDLSVILTSAMPPPPFDEPPAPASTIRGAIRNLERETELLLIEARTCHPFNETLHELIERLQ